MTIRISKLGHVNLRVADEEASKRFYTEVLGFQVAEQDLDHGGVFTTLGEDFHNIDFAQHPDPTSAQKPQPGQVGLVHIAFQVASHAALRDAYIHLLEHRVQVNHAANHLNQRSIYFNDPDGNGLEIYYELPYALQLFPDGRGDDDLELEVSARRTTARLAVRGLASPRHASANRRDPQAHASQVERQSGACLSLESLTKREVSGMADVNVNETIFTMDSSSIKFGPGATREVGEDMQALGARRVMVVTDPRIARLEPVALALQSLRAVGIDAVLFDRVRVEPTDASFQEAIRFATDGNFDGYVAVGGGSSIDTAKAANLYATYPADFLAYVNAPIGRGEPVPGRLKPLVAIPTTAGTGSETTGVAIFDLVEMHAKTGIAHRALRPAIGIIDPNNTRELPAMVAACSGFDVLSHAIESYTALPYTGRPAPSHLRLRPSYQGANPISDLWAERAIGMVAQVPGARGRGPDR